MLITAKNTINIHTLTPYYLVLKVDVCLALNQCPQTIMIPFIRSGHEG